MRIRYFVIATALAGCGKVSEKTLTPPSVSSVRKAKALVRRFENNEDGVDYDSTVKAINAMPGLDQVARSLLLSKLEEIRKAQSEKMEEQDQYDDEASKDGIATVTVHQPKKGITHTSAAVRVASRTGGVQTSVPKPKGSTKTIAGLTGSVESSETILIGESQPAGISNIAAPKNKGKDEDAKRAADEMIKKQADSIVSEMEQPGGDAHSINGKSDVSIAAINGLSGLDQSYKTQAIARIQKAKTDQLALIEKEEQLQPQRAKLQHHIEAFSSHNGGKDSLDQLFEAKKEAVEKLVALDSAERRDAISRLETIRADKIKAIQAGEEPQTQAEEKIGKIKRLKKAVGRATAALTAGVLQKKVETKSVAAGADAKVDAEELRRVIEEVSSSSKRIDEVLASKTAISGSEKK